MKKQHSLFFLLLFVGVANSWAEAVTPDQAKQIASQFLTNNTIHCALSSAHRAPAQSDMTVVAVFDSIDPTGHPYLYAVNTSASEGFVLVSGDDRYNMVLGYSTGSTFDELNMPENMRAWMQSYIAEMKYLESNGYQPTPRKTVAVKTAINPLLTTTWGQGSPYNDLCPNSYPSGCVATAMAQVINYHLQKDGSKPTKILNNIPAYTTDSYQIPISGIAAGTDLPNPSDLLDDYANGAGTQTQKQAVAQLMFYCGVSLKMNYGPNGSNNTIGPEYGLVEHFGFDPNTTRLLRRGDYTYQKWMDIIYDELAAGRPMYYSGATATGGHAFVVDGYDGEGLFHVNWGWGGSCDAYFALSVLNPDDDGQIGASASNEGYAIDQRVIVGAYYNPGEYIELPISLHFTDLKVTNNNKRANCTVFNLSGETHNFDYSWGFVDDQGHITSTTTAYSFHNLQNCTGFGYNYTFKNDPSLSGQTIRVVPVSKLVEADEWQTGFNPEITYFEVVYDANGEPTVTLHPIINLSGSITVPSNKKTGNTQTVSITLTNTGEELYCPIYLLADTGQTKRYVSQLGLTALESSTQTVQLEWTPTVAGTYTLWVATDRDGTNVFATESVTITDDTCNSDKTIAFSGFMFDAQDMQSYVLDDDCIVSIDVYDTDLNGKVTFKNVSKNRVDNFVYTVAVEKWNGTSYNRHDHDIGAYYSGDMNPGDKRDVTLRNLTGLSIGLYRMFVEEINTSNWSRTRLDDRILINMRGATGYTITYDLGGGSLSKANPTTYTIRNGGFTLNNPTRDGYTFAGWTGTDLTVPVKHVTIPANSMGDRSYTATWIPNIYAITWQMDDGSLIDTTHVAYGMMPTHAEPTKATDAEYTYTFAGWSPDVVVVTGEATYKATFDKTKNTSTGIDQTTDNPLPISGKVLIDGSIYILRGDNIYTIIGQKIR